MSQFSSMSAAEIGVVLRLLREQWQSDLQAARNAAQEELQGISAKVDLDISEAEQQIEKLHDESDIPIVIPVSLDSDGVQGAAAAIGEDIQQSIVSSMMRSYQANFPGLGERAGEKEFTASELEGIEANGVIDREAMGVEEDGGGGMGGLGGIFMGLMVARMVGKVAKEYTDQADLSQEEFDTSQMPVKTAKERVAKAKHEVEDEKKQTDADSGYTGLAEKRRPYNAGGRQNRKPSCPGFARNGRRKGRFANGAGRLGGQRKG